MQCDQKHPHSSSDFFLRHLILQTTSTKHERSECIKLVTGGSLAIYNIIKIHMISKKVISSKKSKLSIPKLLRLLPRKCSAG